MGPVRVGLGVTCPHVPSYDVVSFGINAKQARGGTTITSLLGEVGFASHLQDPVIGPEKHQRSAESLAVNGFLQNRSSGDTEGTHPIEYSTAECISVKY